MTGPGLTADESAAIEPEKFLSLIAPKLQLVEEELRRNFSSEITTIREVADHTLDGGGKRLRPTLLLLVSEMLGYEGMDDVIYAAVVEFIHTATLVHDDVIDEASMRRGRTSINYRWGNQITVLIGDFLYAHAMEMALRVGRLDALKLLCRATIEMTEGEILALETNGRADLTVDDYFQIVERKTAALFAATCRVPGFFVGASEVTASRLYEFGRNLGIGFQLIDDLLDFTSSTEVLGKPALSDLKEGKLTLPLILSLPAATADERALIAKIASEKSFGETDPAMILELAQKYGGVEKTKEYARTYIERARTALEHFPPSPSRAALTAALDFVVARNR
jgi:octaprenyl-diphosphate synthase